MNIHPAGLQEYVSFVIVGKKQGKASSPSCKVSYDLFYVDCLRKKYVSQG
jgi:hypothetical protein